jgi:phosphate/sulfate permease
MVEDAFIQYKKKMITTDIVTSVAVIFLAGPLIAVIWAVISFPLLFWYLNSKSKDEKFIANLKDEVYQQKSKKALGTWPPVL